MQTRSTSAEYGAYLGVRINVITKSGTNTLHGTAFEFLRNQVLDARGFFNSATAPKYPLRQNQFGVEVDGPVVLPKIYTCTTGYSSWQANAIMTIQGGAPFNVSISGDVANTSSPPQAPSRPPLPTAAAAG